MAWDSINQIPQGWARNSGPDAERCARIIVRLQADDADALRELAQIYARELGAIAVSITGARDLAQDVFQDVLLNVWDQRSALGEVSDLTGFLRKITRRRAIDLVRKERSQHRLAEEVVKSQTPDLLMVTNVGVETLDKADLRSEILSALKTVPPRSREIFLMHWEGSMTYEEIADTLDISRETVYKQMSRAMKALVVYFQTKRSQ